MKEGWLCPRCEKVNSPDIVQCLCEPDLIEKLYEFTITGDDIDTSKWTCTSVDGNLSWQKWFK